MDLVAIRNKIVSNLYGLTGKPVIFIPTENPIPPYPFTTYSFISTYIDGASHEELKPSTSGYVNRELVTQSEFSLSFNSYSRDSIECKQLIKTVWDFFKHSGYHKLKELDLVVVEVTNIENRDILEVDKYERREGFDVRIRVVDTISRQVETIDKFNVSNGIIK